jgi:hypothetical protein
MTLCKHRFHNQLLPKPGMKYLFIGTFNPILKVKKGVDPDFFYSRPASLFWCILPHAFNDNCLVDKDRADKEVFCKKYKIGLSDLIYSVKVVSEEIVSKDFLIKGFKDEDFEKKLDEKYAVNIKFFTEELKDYINTNRGFLKGVFLTRKTSTGIKRIWEQWLEIKFTCKELEIYCDEIASPSPRGGGIRDKIFEWRNHIEKIEFEETNSL